MSSASRGGASPSDRAAAAGDSLELARSGGSLSDAPQAKLPAPRDGNDRDSAETFGEDDGHRQDQHAQDAGGLDSQRGKRNKPVKWSAEEDRRLREAVKRFSEARWKDIARVVKTRNHVQCLQRWKKVLKPGLVKGQWSAEEDDRLVSLVERGFRNWGQVASFMDGRTSKQCRERWCHHLDPAVRKGGYTAEEDDLIIFLQGEVGNRWADIAKRLTGRTENAVKIRWKALNRRQRDARNKAAQAAAVASATGAASPPPESQKPKPAPRTGAREGTRAQVRAASRVSSSSSSFTSGNASVRGAATPRTGTGAAELAASRGASASRCDSPASFRLRNPQRRDAPKPPAPANVPARLPSPAANGSAGERPPSGPGVVASSTAIATAAAAAAIAPGVSPRISIAGAGDNHPWMPLGADRGGRDRGTEHASRAGTTFAADVGLSETASATGAETAASWPDMKPVLMSAAAGAGTTGDFPARDPPGRSSKALADPAGSEGGGLHRLCAALRNVEAMDSLQVSGDDEMVDAAASAAAERFRLRSCGGGGRYGAGGPCPFPAKSDAEGGRAAHFSGGGGDVKIGRDRDRSRPEERSGSSALSLPSPPPRRLPFPPVSVEEPEREKKPSVAPSTTAAQPAACVPAREMRSVSASTTTTAAGVIHPRRLSSPTLAGTTQPMVFSPGVLAKTDTAESGVRSSQPRESRPQPLLPRLQSGPPRPCDRPSPNVVATVEAGKVTEVLAVMRSTEAMPALAETSVGPSPRPAAGRFSGGNPGRGLSAAAAAAEGGGCRKMSAVVGHGAAPATVGRSKRARQGAEEEEGGAVDAAPGGGPFTLVRDRLHKRARSPPVTPSPMTGTVAVTSSAAIEGADVAAGSNSTSRGVGIHVSPAACVAVPAAE